MTISWIIGQCVLGWLLGDFLTGLLHWAEDNFGDENTPLIGKLIIKPNRDHHVDPMAFTYPGFWYRNTTTIGATAIVSILIWLPIFGPSIIWAVATIGASFANEIHSQAHKGTRANPLFQIAARTGVLQSSSQHCHHHFRDKNRSYCSVSSWLNPILDATGFWRMLERPFIALGVRVHWMDGR